MWCILLWTSELLFPTWAVSNEVFVKGMVKINRYQTTEQESAIIFRRCRVPCFNAIYNTWKLLDSSNGCYGQTKFRAIWVHWAHRGLICGSGKINKGSPTHPRRHPTCLLSLLQALMTTTWSSTFLRAWWTMTWHFVISQTHFNPFPIPIWSRRLTTLLNGKNRLV